MIAIPNMDKPKSCEKCPFETCFIRVNIKSYACLINGDECGKTDCPLIEIVQCKDCIHFHYDKPYIIQGMPVFGHEVCDFWGDGCKTNPNGGCTYGEGRTDERITE